MCVWESGSREEGLLNQRTVDARPHQGGDTSGRRRLAALGNAD